MLLIILCYHFNFFFFFQENRHNYKLWKLVLWHRLYFKLKL